MYTIEPITASRIMVAYPLMRLADPDLTPGAWRGEASQFPPGAASPGCLAALDSRGFPHAATLHGPCPTAEGRTLVLKRLAFLDGVIGERPIGSLLAALDRLAMSLGCVSETLLASPAGVDPAMLGFALVGSCLVRRLKGGSGAQGSEEDRRRAEPQGSTTTAAPIATRS